MYTFCVGWPAGLRNYIWREIIIFLGLRAFEGHDQASGHQEGKDQLVRGEGLSGCREERGHSPAGRKGKEAGGKPQVTRQLLPRPGGGFLPLVRTRLHREHNDKKMLPVLLRGSLLGIERQGL